MVRAEPNKAFPRTSQTANAKQQNWQSQLANGLLAGLPWLGCAALHSCQSCDLTSKQIVIDCWGWLRAWASPLAGPRASHIRENCNRFCLIYYKQNRRRRICNLPSVRPSQVDSLLLKSLSNLAVIWLSPFGLSHNSCSYYSHSLFAF